MSKIKNGTAAPFQFVQKDIQILSKEIAYEGYFKILKYHFKHRCFSGSWSQAITRELFERGHAVALLPYDPITDTVILIEQIRVGAIAANQSPWQLEIIAGIIETDETSEEVAMRESKEEAGLNVSRLIPMLKYLSSSGGCSETIQLYLGIVDASKSGGIYGLAAEDEDILVHTVARETAMQWLTEGKIENAASIIALQWLALNAKSKELSPELNLIN